MKLKIRKLNAGEKYACNINDVKSIFDNENIYVSFGFLSKSFKFDTSDRIKAKIEGNVIVSSSINKRDIIDYESIGHICFYAIKDLEYNEEKQKKFSEMYLPLLYEWYRQILSRPETSLSGVNNFLIEWVRGDFITHCYRYH
jgi:hypothetical protein